MRYFSEAVHFFEEFKFLCNEMFYLDGEIKKHFKCKHFFEAFKFYFTKNSIVLSKQ